jgi:hypothetical protein
MIKYKNLTTDQALEEIRTKRPVAGPNMGKSLINVIYFLRIYKAAQRL